MERAGSKRKNKCQERRLITWIQQPKGITVWSVSTFSRLEGQAFMLTTMKKE